MPYEAPLNEVLTKGCQCRDGEIPDRGNDQQFDDEEILCVDVLCLRQQILHAYHRDDRACFQHADGLISSRRNNDPGGLGQYDYA